MTGYIYKDSLQRSMILFTSIASGGGFLSTATKSMQKRRLKPMVSKPPLLSRALLVMGRKGNRLSNRPAAAPTQRKGRVGLPPWRTDCHSQCAHRLRNDTSFSCHSEETVEAPPVADEARRFRGSVPVFTPQRGWKPVDTTVKAFCCCWQKVCRRRQTEGTVKPLKHRQGQREVTSPRRPAHRRFR